jgi:hypothetical protein
MLNYFLSNGSHYRLILPHAQVPNWDELPNGWRNFQVCHPGPSDLMVDPCECENLEPICQNETPALYGKRL